MSDVYVMGVDMIKFGRFPEKTVPELGAQAALMALDDAGLKIQDMQALYWATWAGQRHGWPADSAANWADRYRRGQLLKCLCDGRDGFPRGLDVDQSRGE